MPELPEVETMVRGIRSQLEGAKIIDVALPPCHCRPILIQPEFPQLRATSQGQTVQAVTRKAKRVLIHLQNGTTFVIEPRMTGLMLVGNPPDAEHLRFEWKLKTGRTEHSIWFWDRRGLGTLRLMTAQEFESELGPARLGPDALELTAEHLVSVLSRTSRPIKVALLDQKLIGGIGNLYASEILHLARIAPDLPANQLNRRQLDRLLSATLSILQEAILYEGSTLGDGTYRNALNKDGSYQNKHRVYAREGEQCVSCKRAEIVRIVQAQRSTFYCPRCQKP
ncbi:bifunctional DNA-formamidopyrimidine glycosylase/DNA-(apurinic or apyrimidinic site) lyase [Planctomicrobium sp. SH527]|uniref:bifunctional DNA-formamidopyrimidine glycosylase/DNA-(apurinic or apyrimidinic site) lyase n=1 Tax=Planctomicrobium sp. SH527 TaxID=3448123 RepID=UPI003F5AFE73